MLTGKVALVTGAARGLGEAIVRRMVVEGATVIAADRRTEEGSQLAAELRIRFASLDVTEPAQWASLVAEVAAEHGRIDVLVNNAGIIRVRPYSTARQRSSSRSSIPTSSARSLASKPSRL